MIKFLHSFFGNSPQTSKKGMAGKFLSLIGFAQKAGFEPIPIVSFSQRTDFKSTPTSLGRDFHSDKACDKDKDIIWKTILALKPAQRFIALSQTDHEGKTVFEKIATRYDPDSLEIALEGTAPDKQLILTKGLNLKEFDKAQKKDLYNLSESQRDLLRQDKDHKKKKCSYQDVERVALNISYILNAHLQAN